MPRKTRITHKDGAAAVAMLDAEPTHDPAVQYPPEIENARTLLTDAGWRVKPPLKGRTRTPAAPREYAAAADIRSWLDGATARLGTQQKVAEAVGLRNIGPIAAGARGRPMTRGKFEEVQGAYAEHLGTNPPHPAVKSKAAPKAKVARKARAAKAPAKAKAKSPKGNLRTVKPPVRAMGSGAVARASRKAQPASN